MLRLIITTVIDTQLYILIIIYYNNCYIMLLVASVSYQHYNDILNGSE